MGRSTIKQEKSHAHFLFTKLPCGSPKYDANDRFVLREVGETEI